MTRRTMLIWVTLVLAGVGGLVMAQGSGAGSEAEVSQRMAELQEQWAGRESWPVLDLESIEHAPIEPFRAVFERRYRSHAAGSRGERREDRYVWTVERIGWKGAEAYAVQQVDSGNAKWDDASARVHAKTIDAETHRLLFSVFPLSGTWGEYVVVRSLESGVRATLVSETGRSDTFDVMSTSGALDELSYELALATMPLQEGLQFRIPFFSATRREMSTLPARVAGKHRVRVASGASHEVWVIETPYADGRLRRIYVAPEPPYYFGSEIDDFMNGEIRPWHTLHSFTVLERE